VIFEVFGDGKKLAESRPMKWGMPGEPIDVDVSAASLVELVARSTTASNEALPVTWGNAALTAGSAKVPGSN
jgi:alpha-galactosidase